MFIKRIEHAAGPISIGFLHLLGADVDGPPEGTIHSYVIVKDILDKPGAFISRVGLHIDGLEWFDELHVPECNIPDAVTAAVGWDTAYTHAHPQNNSTVLHQHILSAVPTMGVRIGRLGDYNIVVVEDREVVDVHASPTGINAIRVKREQRDKPFKGKLLEKVDLGGDINLDVDVVEFSIVTVVHLEVKLR